MVVLRDHFFVFRLIACSSVISPAFSSSKKPFLQGTPHSNARGCGWIQFRANKIHHIPKHMILFEVISVPRINLNDRRAAADASRSGLVDQDQGKQHQRCAKDNDTALDPTNPGSTH